MQYENAYYCEEYQEFRRNHEYIFQDTYKSGEKILSLFEGTYQIHVTNYSDRSLKQYKFWVEAASLRIIDDHGVLVSEIKSLNNGVSMIKGVSHSNGINYLITSFDQYGYCVLDLTSRIVFHYVPVAGKGEPFIWTNLLYCRQNNLLAVDGCYWASTFSTEIFDFSRPESIPYEKVFDSFSLEGEVSIDHDIIPLRWNEDGTIVLSCCIDEEDKIRSEKTIAIKST